VIHILVSFAKHGAPSDKVHDWTGRWWSLWGAVDLVPMGETVMIAVPSLPNTFAEAGEVSVSDKDNGRFTAAAGTARYGENVQRIRRADGTVSEVWFGGTRFVPEAEAAAELEKRCGSQRRYCHRRRARIGHERGTVVIERNQ
jgi:D-alanyl-D-alanine carboxypeptidase